MLKNLAKKNNLEDCIGVLEKLSIPCFQGREGGNTSELGCSKVGGFPHVNEGFRWPKYFETPLEFVAQINLADIEGSNLPSNGMLLFFYASGVCVDEKGHKNFIRVVHILDTKNLEVKEPEYEHKKRFGGLLKPKITPNVFDEHNIKFHRNSSLPDLDNVDTIPSLSVFDNDDELLDSYYNLKYGLSGGGLQIGGYPNPVQYDGITAGAASIMEKGSANEWELLLEVDSKLGFMWGDAGRLYFCIHKDDLAKAKFSDVWMDFQCH